MCLAPQVSRLNGKQFQPPGPWDAQPPPGVEQRGGAQVRCGTSSERFPPLLFLRCLRAIAACHATAYSFALQQNNSKGKKDGKGGKDGRGKDKAAGKGGSGRKKEEEEVVMDPWDPRVALPQEGELLVEYRSVCMPPFDPEGKDEASQGSLSGVSREAFDRIWAPEQVAGETDLWRLGYVHAMCTRFRLTSEQAASTLKTFTHSKATPADALNCTISSHFCFLRWIFGSLPSRPGV